MIGVVVVDDHTLVRESVAGRLQKEEDIEVLASVPDADEAVSVISEKRPQVVLMDIDMPGLLCFEALRQIRKVLPELRCVFVSAHTSDSYIDQALGAGAVGYLTKEEPYERLLGAIREVAAGGSAFSGEVMERLTVDERGVRLTNSDVSRLACLTTRELEVLQYIAKGLGKKEIAGILDVSVKTIDKHAENLMRKLQIHDRVQLARFAIKEGLAHP